MSETINYTDFNIICRVCLVKSEDMVSVQNSQIMSILEEWTSVQESLYEKLPQQICKNCFSQLKNILHFKQQCILSFEILCKIILKENESVLEQNQVRLSEEKETDAKENGYVSENLNNTKKELETVKIFDHENLKNDGFKVENKFDVQSIEFNSDYENESLDAENDNCDQNDEENIDNKFKTLAKNNLFEKQQKSLADILRKKYNIYDLTCNICKKVLSTRFTLIRHMEIHDQNRKLQYRCRICNKGFYAAENVRKHENRHMGKTKHQCDKCSKRFYVLSALAVHYKSSHKAKPIKCDKCTLEFYHKLQLERHKQVTHERKQYVCDFCGKTFSIQYYLREHQIAHSEKRFYSCTYCNKGFKHKGTLNSHIKLQHIYPERREMCNVCGKLIAPTTLRSHLESHNKNIYKCTHCGKVYTNKYVLRKHINEKHSTDSTTSGVICEICNKNLANKRTLKVHMNIMHSDVKRRECHICGKTYKLQSNVIAHIQSAHMNVRPHICTTCNKAFHTKTLLRRHIRTHTGERPFSCNICGKSFGFKGVLHKHMNVHSK